MEKIFSLKGKNIIITGAAGFFGQYFARGVLDNGAKKLIVIEYPKVGDKFYKDLVSKYGKNKIEWHKTDLYDTKETEKCYEDILKKNKRVDVLLHNPLRCSGKRKLALSIFVCSGPILSAPSFGDILLRFRRPDFEDSVYPEHFYSRHHCSFVLSVSRNKSGSGEKLWP